MANRAYLVANDRADTAGTTADGINYDLDSEIIAAASTLIPVLWLSLFDEDDIRYHELDGERIGGLLTTTANAKKRLRYRSALLKKVLPDNATQLSEWKQLVAGIPFDFVKVDAAEIWAMQPESFGATIRAAVRWFSSKADEDLHELMSISATIGGVEDKSFQFDDPAKQNLYGYKWIRAVPWDDMEVSAAPRRRKRAVEISIKPVVLEKHPQLTAFIELDYFYNAGNPVKYDWAVSKGKDLLDAYLFFARERRWTWEAGGWMQVMEWIEANVAKDARSYYKQQIDEIDTTCLEIYWKCIFPRMPRELRLYKHCADLYFAHDLMHITIERELVGRGMPEGFCSKLLQVYQTGHLPCGWDGEYPVGKMIMH